MSLKSRFGRPVVDDLELMESLYKDKVYFDEINFRGCKLGFIGLLHGSYEERMGGGTKKNMLDTLNGRTGPVYAEYAVVETSSLLKDLPDRIVPIDRIDSLWNVTLGQLKSHRAPHLFRDLDRVDEGIKDWPQREEGDVELVRGRYPAQRYYEKSYWAKHWPAIMNENLVQRFSGGFNDVDEHSFFKGEVLYLRGRSLLMAGEVAKDLGGRDAESATVVQGMDHMSETITFLQKPNLAVKYAQRLKKSI